MGAPARRLFRQTFYFYRQPDDEMADVAMDMGNLRSARVTAWISYESADIDARDVSCLVISSSTAGRRAVAVLEVRRAAISMIGRAGMHDGRLPRQRARRWTYAFRAASSRAFQAGRARGTATVTRPTLLRFPSLAQ